MVVGITGGIGTGKSTVVSLFEQLGGVAVYIADVEAKKIMNTSSAIRSKLIKEFGFEAYKNDELNRKYIAAIVFSNPKKLKKLNAIVHPEVAKHFQNFIDKNKERKYILYENAILFENNSAIFCDYVITISTPLKSRLQRVIARDNITKEEVLNRIKNQWNETKKQLQSNYLIENDSIEKTKFQVQKIHNLLLLKK